MKIVTITNLYPTPEQPQRGIFNAQLFESISEYEDVSITNIVLVPEWKFWKHSAIRKWRSSGGMEGGTADTTSPRLRSTSERGLTQIKTSYLPVFYIPKIGRNFSVGTYSKALNKVKNSIASCDLVLATWLYPDAVAAVKIAKKLNKPVWIKVHGSDTFHLENAGRCKKILKAVEYAEGILPNCQYLADKLIEAGVDEEKVHVVPNGIDEEVFHCTGSPEERKSASFRTAVWKQMVSPGPVLKKLESINPYDKIVLFVGNLVHVKGPDVLVKSATFLRRIRAAYHGSRAANIVIVGDGPMRKSLQKLVRKQKVEDTVTFIGELSHDEVAKCMNISNCLVLSSRSEGMPNVITEALSTGLPVVATDVGACSEILEEEDRSRIVEPDDPKGLAAAIQEVLKTSGNRNEMAESYRGVYSWDYSAELILGLMMGEEEESE